MKTYFSKLLAVTAAVLLLSACATGTIQMGSLNNLHKGMQRAEVSSTLRTQPIKTISVYAKKKLVQVDVYNLTSGDYASNYFVAYGEDGSLIFWGYPNEFARSSNPFINEIGRNALAILSSAK